MKLLVITATTLFPNGMRPNAGMFFANMLLRLRPLVEDMVVVTPTPCVPSFIPIASLAKYRLVRPHELWRGIEVYRPQYLSIRSNTRGWFQSRSFALGAEGICLHLHRRRQFDLVLSNGFGPPAHAGQKIAGLIGRRCVAWAIGSDVHRVPDMSRENLRLLRHNVRHCDAVVAVSQAIAEDICRRCPGARNVHTFYRGIDLAELRAGAGKEELRRKLGLRLDRRYMLSAGDVNVHKGAWEFYRAFKQVHQSHADLCAIWVGGGSESEPLRKQAAADGLGDFFTVTGQVSRSCVLEHMMACDLMAFPSYAEGLPNVVMEAMACGLPTVATAVGGTPEIIADGRTGLLVQPRDAGALAGAVARILGDQAAAARMAGAGRELIFRFFDVDRNVLVLRDVLQELAGGGPVESPIPCCAELGPGQLPVSQALAQGAL